MRYEQAEVLTIHTRSLSRGTVRRHYMVWRRLHDIPERCDAPECTFHQSPLVWNGRRLPLILDHRSGNALDNTPGNLRLLCPNCDAQNALTRGGANAGRIERMAGGSYQVRNRDGTQSAYAFGSLPTVLVEAPSAVATGDAPKDGGED
jgi:hypothetical protein